MSYYLNRVNEVIEGIKELNKEQMKKAEERLNSLCF